MSRISRIAVSWRDLGRAIASYLAPARVRETVADRAALRRFIETRSSFVAQTSLYGYLRTRAGMRYPALFDDDAFVTSINIAKWHVWLACVSDLSIYAGGLLANRYHGPVDEVSAVMREVLDDLLRGVGVPHDAGPDFQHHAARVRSRLAGCDLAGVTDDEAAFRDSPVALVRWAPIIDELKDLDQGIVRNSVRFRWQDARRDLRADLDPAAIMADGARTGAA